MSSLPSVSVIVVNWNRRTLLRECLASLVAQTYSPFETIVVDNGSTDGSGEMVATEFPQARIIALDSNRGFAGGNNAGIRVARGEFIALLNNDAVAEPTWLDELMRAIQDTRVGLVASRVIFFDSRDRLDSAGDGLSFTGSGFRRGHLCSPAEYEHTEFVFGASGSAALYRRTMLEQIGLFDEDFFAVYEDVDLSFRARLAGYRCLYAPQAKVYHHAWSTVGHLSKDYVYWGHRNVEYLFWKNMPLPLLLLCFFPHLLYELAGCIYFGLRGHLYIYGKAKWDALCQWRTIYAKRKIVQQSRRIRLVELIRLMDWNIHARLREKFLM